MTGGSSRIRLARPRVYLFSLVLAFILFAETYCSQDDFDFKPFDFGAVPQNALALLKNSRTQFSANMPNVASIRDSMDKTAFSVDDLKSRFLIPVKDTPDFAMLVPPKAIDFSSFDFTPKFPGGAAPFLVDLQSKFPQLSDDFLKNAFSSAAKSTASHFDAPKASPANTLSPVETTTPFPRKSGPSTSAVKSSPVTITSTLTTPVKNPSTSKFPAEMTRSRVSAPTTSGIPSSIPATTSPVPVKQPPSSTSPSVPVTSTAPVTSPPPQTTSKPKEAPGTLSGLFGSSRPENIAPAKQASTLEGVSKSVSTALNLTNDEIPGALSEVTVPVTISNCSIEADVPRVSLADPFSSSELARLPCAQEKYRSVNGHCNNVAFPNRGKESTVFGRLLNPDYADGISLPRLSARRTPLPSARLVSASLVGTDVRLAPTWTLMFMQFGQFLDHDLTHTPQSQLPQRCCAASNSSSSAGASVFPDLSTLNGQCLPIEISANDPFYSKFGQGCMEFVRSLPGTRPGCTLGPRDQINQVSSYIDGNQIYSSTTQQSITLRLMQDGLLRITVPFPSKPRYSLLPADKNNATCSDATLARPCFDAGDNRVNVQIGLQAVHTVFLRHHNIIAQRLKTINPGWTDEKLYQEARAIIAAQLQHITYNEWLPVLLGFSQKTNPTDVSMDTRMISSFSRGLKLVTDGRFQEYNVTISPAISNEFATAAFRVGHTMVTGQFHRLTGSLQPTTTENVRDSFFRSSRLYDEDAVDEMIIGMIKDQGKAVENNVVGDLSQLLFRSPAGSFGLDLVSLNIQRGRDHGIPGYMSVRRLCQLPTANSFQQIRELSILPDDVAVRMASVYDSVEDIDLYVAGISEARLKGAVIGPTFACVIGEQFARLRRADRFWYENDLPVPSRFSDAQLREIRKTSLARILCDMVLLMEQTQTRVFETVSDGNPMVSCQGPHLPSLDLTWWKD